MKFVSKRFEIDIEPCKDSEFFDVINCDGDPIEDQVTLEYLKKHFDPVGCDSLDLVDPDRTKRLSE